ncbi:MAG TPA: heme exporter protein CcmB [Ilumatobacter sp.]|nr:heme exporter protein CcmB [Ilumatobacter sp.]
MSSLRIARLVARKDLAIERRSKVAINQVLPFAAITMILFAFALDSSGGESGSVIESVEVTDPQRVIRTTDVLELVAPGLIWLAVLFSLLILVQRSFAVESDDGALDALRVAGVDPAAIFWGKAVALGIQLLVLEIVLVGIAVLLYRADLPPAGLGMLAITLFAATCGLAFVGTLYGGLTAGFSGRESLLPLLVLPVVAPVLIGATRAVESAFGTDGVALSEGWPWIGLLVVFAVAFGVGGALAFGPLIDEAT